MFIFKVRRLQAELIDISVDELLLSFETTINSTMAAATQATTIQPTTETTTSGKKTELQPTTTKPNLKKQKIKFKVDNRLLIELNLLFTFYSFNLDFKLNFI